MGLARTYDRITQKFYWPKAYRDAERFVRSCPECQRRKAAGEKYGFQQHIRTPTAPFHTIGIDLVSLNPTRNGNRVIATAVCHLTKYLVAEALPDGSAEEVAKFLVNKIILVHGAPSVLISDRGKTFMSAMLAEVSRRCGIDHRRTSPYHPQTNGLTERSHRTLADMLSKLANDRQSDWDEVLPSAVHAYNTTVQRSTKFSPFFLVHGREAPSTFSSQFPAATSSGPPSAAGEFGIALSERLQHAWRLAQTLADQEKEGNKAKCDTKRVNPEFKVGDRVMLHVPVRTVGLSDKLRKRYFGPYNVVRVTGPVNVEVLPLPGAVLPGTRREKQNVHVSRLKPFVPRSDPVTPRFNCQPGDQEPVDRTVRPEHTEGSHRTSPYNLRPRKTRDESFSWGENV